MVYSNTCHSPLPALLCAFYLDYTSSMLSCSMFSMQIKFSCQQASGHPKLYGPVYIFSFKLLNSALSAALASCRIQNKI